MWSVSEEKWMDLWIISSNAPPISVGDWVCCAGNIYINWDILCVFSSPPPVRLGQRAVGILLRWIERQTKLAPRGHESREEQWAERWRAEWFRAQHTGTNQVQSATQKLTHMFRMSDPGRLWVEQTGSFLNFKAGDFTSPSISTPHFKGETKESIDFYSGNDCQNIPCTQVQLTKSGDKEGKEGTDSLQSTEMAFHLVNEGQGNPTVHPEPLIPTQTESMFSSQH